MQSPKITSEAFDSMHAHIDRQKRQGDFTQEKITATQRIINMLNEIGDYSREEYEFLLRECEA